jgi:hypothetical protein
MNRRPDSSTSAPVLPSLPARIVGVLLSPRETFAAVSSTPRWLGMLAATVIVAAACQGLFLSTEVGRQAFVDQQVTSREGLGIQVSDEAYAQIERLAAYAAYIQIGGAVVGIPVVTCAAAGLLFGVFGGLLGGQATYRQTLAVVAHSGAVSIVQQLFVTPLNYLRESMSSPANLSVFFPMLDEGSFLASLLGTVELFTVWWVLVLAIGLGVLYRRPTAPIAWGLFAVYAVVAVAVAAVKAALGGA